MIGLYVTTGDPDWLPISGPPASDCPLSSPTPPRPQHQPDRTHRRQRSETLRVSETLSSLLLS